jgi:hypothetical protein
MDALTQPDNAVVAATLPQLSVASGQTGQLGRGAQLKSRHLRQSTANVRFVAPSRLLIASSLAN